MKASKTKPKAPRGRPGKVATKAGVTHATSKEFEREGMGVAAKE